MAEEDPVRPFNVEARRETSDWASYRKFIDSLRDRLRNSTSHNLPVLVPQPGEGERPSQFFNVVLQTNSAEIRLRIRRDNLYLVGYQANGQWFEFRSNSHLIPGSIFLNFDGGYTGLERFAGRGRECISLSQEQLTAALNRLAAAPTDQLRAESLIIVIQMISESLRYRRITQQLATRNEAPPTWMTALENGWGDLSNRLLREDADPFHPFRLPQQAREAMEIWSAEDAVRALGILLFFNYRLHRLPRMVGSDSRSFLQGQPMAEVFMLRINNIDGESPGDLYGTITVFDGLLCQYIYNRARGDAESVYQGGTPFLSGPVRAISACGSFTINLALMDRDRDLSPDDEVSNGTISWNVYSPDTEDDYDKLINVDVGGRNGSATVYYAVFRDAVEASIEVILINGDGEDPADVYGDIFASNSKINGGESVLFSKEKDDHIDVKPGQRIPLLRSVVAVPSDSSLKVRAKLYDHDSISPDDEIANGTAVLPAKTAGTSTQNIKGRYGEIQVKVTWNM